MAMSLLQRSALGVYRQHPWQSLLMLSGMIFSVAVVVAIDLVIASAQRSFKLSQQAITGDATHQLLREGEWLEESLLGSLRRDLGVRPALPVLELSAVETLGGRRLRLLGVDLLAEAELRPWLAGAGSDGQFELSAFFDDVPSVLMAQALAEQLALQVGDMLPLRVRGNAAQARVGAVISAQGVPGAGDELLIMDVGAAQTLAALPGKLSRIDLQILQDEQIARLRQALPTGVVLAETRLRAQQTLDMSQAFALNLRAMSLLALLVGVFLIFQTLRFMVLRRTVLIGLWRALGVRSGEIAVLLLREAAMIGLLTGILGAMLGVLLAHALLDMVVTTINDLYFRLSATQVSLAPALLAKGVALAVSGALLAALLPLHDALSVPALGNLGRSRIEQLARRQISQIWPWGLLLAVGALLTLRLGPASLLLSFAAVFTLIVGVMACIPAASALILDAGGRLARSLPLLIRLALAHARLGLSRTGIATAALALAMATVIGMATMIHSFRSSVIHWIDASLTADIYVSSSDPGGVLSSQLVSQLGALPQVAETSQLRRISVMHDSGPLMISSLATGERGFSGYQWAALGHDDPYQAFLAGDVLISEPLARRLQRAPGDTLRLPTPQGHAELRIAAVFRDFTSSQGIVTVEQQHFQALFGERDAGAMGLYALAGTEQALYESALALIGEQDSLSMVRADSIRQQTLAIFDRTFAVTRVIHWLAAGIAFVAILGALLGMELERRRDYLLLRASGFLRGQLTGLRLMQTLALGMIAALLALPFGLLLAWVLVDVINQRAFGWSIELALDWMQIAQALLLAPLAALAAGLVAGWVQHGEAPGQTLREGMNT